MSRFKSVHLLAGLLPLVLASCGSKQPEAQAPSSAAAEEPAAPPAATAPPPAPVTTEPAPPETGAAPPPEQAPMARAEPLSDEQVAMASDLAHTSEIDQAKIAQGKAKDARVKKFAAMMINDHGQAKKKQAKLVTKLNMKPADSPLAAQMKVDSEATLASLKGVTGADFDRTYMASQVDAHQKLLDALDRDLIPSASNPELKSLLMELRPIIESHLKEAQDIQTALATTPTGTESKR